MSLLDAPQRSRMPSAVVPVSVVIPTRGRPELVVRAVRSALEQSARPAEVVVVVDGPDPATVAALAGLDDPSVVVVEHPTSRGAAAARNTGIGRARSAWVALLDDDDTWRPEKLARQLAHVGELPRGRVVTSCGVAWAGTGSPQHWPLRAPRPGEPVAEYLFCRRRAGEGFLATPTILLPRELALGCPFPEHLAVHEDLDWFLSLEDAGATFEVVLESLADVDGAAGRASLSGQQTAAASLAWALSRRDRLGPRAFSAFCLRDVARALPHPVRPGGAWPVLRAAMTGRPHPRDLVAFVAAVLVPARARVALRRFVERESR